MACPPWNKSTRNRKTNTWHSITYMSLRPDSVSVSISVQFNFYTFISLMNLFWTTEPVFEINVWAEDLSHSQTNILFLFTINGNVSPQRNVQILKSSRIPSNRAKHSLFFSVVSPVVILWHLISAIHLKFKCCIKHEKSISWWK